MLDRQLDSLSQPTSAWCTKPYSNQNLSQQTVSLPETSFIAQKGTVPTAFLVNKSTSSTWIVDSGASDHMTGNRALFHEYTLSRDNFRLRIVDGTLSQVAGTGSIKIMKDLLLNSVLHVPNLDCNLLSISKFTRDFHCVTKFFPNLCEFQDLHSGRKIGSAEMCSGLYLLQRTNSPKAPCPIVPYSSLKSQSSLGSCFNKVSDVMLWHYRLGHPNFMYLDKLFPSLFINKDLKFFNCSLPYLSIKI